MPHPSKPHKQETTPKTQMLAPKRTNQTEAEGGDTVTLKPLRVNIQIREYLGDGKYGRSRSLTLYGLGCDEVFDRVEAIFKEKAGDT